ncbi:MAG: hypothetical protein LBR22_10975 [Desulfovibrio sp.]|jgi:hypothetical protein|nr:hypothetical protein [Desulfovibrio sp.]
MDGSPSTPIEAVAQWLDGYHAKVMAEEAQALALLEQGDRDGHARHMRAKATLLADIDKAAKPVLEPLPGERRFKTAHRLVRFSESARTALKLGSIFYMSALLYPADHKKGEPDDLAVFIETLKSDGPA